MMRLGLALSLLVAGPDATAPANPDVVVDVSVGAVDVVVEGWSKKRVEVDADLPAGFTATLDGSGARISVELHGRGVPPSGDLKIKIPKGGELHVRSRNGDVTASGLDGAAHVSTIAGDIRIAGKPTRVEATTTAGSIAISGARSRVDAKTVAGDIELDAPAGDVRIEAVSGDVEIKRAKLQRLEIATVSGDVDIAGTFTKGPHAIAVHSGHIALAIPAKKPLQLEATTFSGTIVDNLASPPKKTRGTYERTIGKAGPRLELSTFNGNITLSPQ